MVRSLKKETSAATSHLKIVLERPAATGSAVVGG